MKRGGRTILEEYRDIFLLYSILGLGVMHVGNAQSTIISGVVMEYRNQKVVPEVIVQIEGSNVESRTNQKGEFVLRTALKG
jgi:hypothetical protein